MQFKSRVRKSRKVGRTPQHDQKRVIGTGYDLSVHASLTEIKSPRECMVRKTCVYAQSNSLEY